MDSSPLPQRVEAALQYLRYCDCRQTRCDSTLAEPTLTPLEASVQQSALRVLQAYFLGEMNYADAPAPRREDEGPEGDAEQPVPAGG